MWWGRRSSLGFAVAALTAVIDQASKLWLLYVFDIAAHVPVHLTPFLDLVLVWNKGISYGLFQQNGTLGQWILIAIKAAAVVFLWMWLARTPSRLTAVALGLITGGAVGNARSAERRVGNECRPSCVVIGGGRGRYNGIDPFLHEGDADFVLFHISTQTIHFNWYVFNFADTAIVAGVAGLLYESVFGEGAAKAPRSGA